MDISTQQPTTVKVSLRWVLLTLLILFASGAVGGIVAARILAPNRVPLRNNDVLPPATTIQEVTISPEKAAVDVVTNSNRSVVLLARDGATPAPVATGLILTNDGLIVTPALETAGTLVALDDQGRKKQLDAIGTDQLYGLSYFRMRETVATPPELRDQEVGVGANVLFVSRAEQTFSPIASNALVSEYVLPEGAGAGIQRLMQLRIDSTPETHRGSPLIADDGTVAGILLNPAERIGISAVEMRKSLERITRGQRELNAFAEIGLSVRYTFAAAEEQGIPVFAPEVTAVRLGSPANIADIRAGDIIESIEGEAVEWSLSLHDQLASAPADQKQIGIRRQGTQRTALVRSESGSQ